MIKMKTDIKIDTKDIYKAWVAENNEYFNGKCKIVGEITAPENRFWYIKLMFDFGIWDPREYSEQFKEYKKLRNETLQSCYKKIEV